MDSFKVGSLMVIDQSEKLVGVITSTDVLILTVHEKNNIIKQLVR